MLGVDSKEANILWFREIGKEDIPVVGGKGANLGEMANNNFPVPPGFVVTAKAYFRYLLETGIKDQVVKTADSIDVENNEQLQRESEKIRELIKRTKMGTPLANEIKKAYTQLCEKRLAWLTSSEEEFVAVRSSATAEDLPTASFAGQQETFLNIKGQNAVVDAVQRCWASLFTARAVYYRKRNNFETEKVGIAVVVQKMVDSKISGVMFTANPVGDETMMVIEAVFGLGETIVSGSVTPDTYTVEKGSAKLLQKQIHSQEFKLVRGGKENVREKLAPAIARKQKLPDKTIIELAKLGKQIESHYKQPQDIEWAIEGKQLLIVQSRPITTLGLKENVVAAEKRKKQMHELEDKIILRGLAASPGIGTGKARIVLNASQIGK
ncbi:MAG: PEP/pyruvate-binding domain-containing protein, partial [Candidatus Diapherotrites archaeon]|nr:PEP/pyruvate-binding domain-containing protein [Candidatus Diapherotrites archaeon]